MPEHCFLKAVCSAQRISLCLGRLRRPHTAGWCFKELSCLSQEPKTLVLDESSTLRTLFQCLHLMDDGEFDQSTTEPRELQIKTYRDTESYLVPEIY